MIYNNSDYSEKSSISLLKFSFFNSFKNLFGKSLLATCIIILFIINSVINFVGCCAYSFTGASVPKHIKTIAIPVAIDKSGSGEPGLGELLTNKLIQKFIDDNTLQIANKSNADAMLECTITSLSDAPAVISAGENVSTRRITITVQAVYRDLVKRKTIFDKSFSNNSDYSATGNINVRRAAIEDAINKISDDILLDTASGW